MEPQSTRASLEIPHAEPRDPMFSIYRFCLVVYLVIQLYTASCLERVRTISHRPVFIIYLPGLPLCKSNNLTQKTLQFQNCGLEASGSMQKKPHQQHGHRHWHHHQHHPTATATATATTSATKICAQGR